MELAEVGIIAGCALFGLVFLFLVVSGNIKKIHTLEQKVETLEKNLLDLTDDTYSTREKPFKAKPGEKTCDTCLHIERCKELNANYYNEAKDLRREVNRLKAHAMINDEHLHIRIKEQARKETASEFAGKVKNKIKELKKIYHEDCINGTGDEEYNGVAESDIDELLKEIE